MRAAALLLISALAAQGATYTSVASGNWNSAGTWDLGAIPGNGDVARIANGHTVTIPSGYTATIGTSPADDTGTPAIACSSGTGTGVLAISGGALVFRGPVNQCNSTWAISGGSHISHDSSLAAVPATANYSWRFTGAASQTGAYLNAIGAPGSRITFDVAAGSGNAGGFRPTTDASTDGNLNLQYVDFSNWGTASGYLVRIYPFNCSTTVVRGLTLRNFTVQSSGEVYVSNALGSCTVDVEDGVITGALTTQALSIGQLSPLNSAIATNGARTIKNVFIEGGELYIAAHASTVWDLGIVLSNLYLRGGTAAGIAPFLKAGQLQTGASGSADLIVMDNRIQSASDSGNIWAGTTTRLMLFRNFQPNAHFIYTTPLPTTIDGWLAWDSVSDTSAAGDIFMISATGSASHAVTIRNGVMLRQPDGAANGTTVNYNTVSTCTAGSNCPAVTVANNTFMTANVGSTGAVGVTTEGNNGAAGLYTAVQDNIVHQQSSATGWITKWTSSLSVVSNFITSADYNWLFNISGNGYFTETSNGEYAAAPGAHDQTGDPLFVEKTRTPLSWAQRWDSSVASMDDVAARYKACFEWRANGTTTCDRRFLDMGSMYNWIRAGWRARNKTTWTASSTGGHVGGVVPDKTFGRTAAGGF